VNSTKDNMYCIYSSSKKYLPWGTPTDTQERVYFPWGTPTDTQERVYFPWGNNAKINKLFVYPSMIYRKRCLLVCCFFSRTNVYFWKYPISKAIIYLVPNFNTFYTKNFHTYLSMSNTYIWVRNLPKPDRLYSPTY
jgi:hypothetical protein